MEMAAPYTLLLVDDNPTNLLLLAQIIELDLPEVKVLTARSGQEGLALAAEHQVDGAFIDVQMPQMSGLEMCRELKADPRHTGLPVVLITAHLASAEMRAAGLEAGAYDFITQPISNVEMLARIKVMLRLCQAEQLQRRDRQQLQQQVVDNSEKLRWLSGLVLSGDGALAEPDQQLLQRLAADLPEPAELTEQLLVEQLAREFPLPWRRTLYKLALLAEIPLPLARKLSEIADIEAVFAYLRRHDLSLLPAVTGRDSFRFRPQVRGWLREQALQSLDAAECQQVLSRAADWYQQQGQQLAALDCLVRAANYPAISQQLSQAGLELLLEKYQPQLQELLSRIPEDAAANCGWMSLYLGAGGVVQDAAAWLELAHSRFVDLEDQRGELLTMSQQLLHYLLYDGHLELGRQRLPRYRELHERLAEHLAPLDRVRARLTLGYAELFYCSQLERASQISTELLEEVLTKDSAELQLRAHLLRSLVAHNQGRLRVARAALEQGFALAGQLSEDSPAVCNLQAVAAELLFSCGEPAAFQRQLRQLTQGWCGTQLKGNAFGPLLSYYSSLLLLARGNYAQAREQLELGLTEGLAAFQPHLKSRFIQLRGLLAARQKQLQAARKDIAAGLELRQQVGGDLFGLNNALLAGASYALLEDYQQAEDCLQKALQSSFELGEERQRGGLHAWLGLVLLRQGDTAGARQQLQQLLELLARQRVAFFLVLTPDLLTELLPLLAGESRHQPLVQQLARNWLEAGLSESGELIPLLQVRTLGGFSLWRQGEPVLDLCEVGQASRQMLAMLLNAPGHSLSLDLLMSQLWPESPTGKARASFDTALSRLRKALDKSLGEKGSRDYLYLEKGMLLLRYVQIDAQDFSQSIELARRQLQRQNPWQAELALWQAEQLWSGDYLSGFDLPGELGYRQSLLTETRLEQLAQLARLLQARRQYDAAEQLLMAGLRLDGTHESLVQQALDIAALRDDSRQRQQILEAYRQALVAEEYATDEIEEILEALCSGR